ncbi:hypothetical protein [Hyphomonas oceanitis]|uniref:hypothetical protein n=1 Tax=Hyphomonas oceanitis TaxID=81033 RepID=UPI003002F4E9
MKTILRFAGGLPAHVCALLLLSACYQAGSPDAESAAPPLKQAISESPTSPPCASEGISSYEDVLFICGSILDGTENAVRTQLAANDISEVRISSSGGDALESMELASLLIESRQQVTFFGICVSGCAHFILASVRNSRVEEGTFIAFHHTATALLAVVQRSDMAIPADALAHLKLQSEIELIFYEAYGIDPKLLIAPLAEMELSCLDFGQESTGPLASFRMRSVLAFFTPYREDFEALIQRDVKGWWPDNLFEFGRSLPDNYEEAYPWERINLGDIEDLSDQIGRWDRIADHC